MNYEEFEAQLRSGEMPDQWAFKDKKGLEQFMEHRSQTIELTDLDCEIAKSSARRKAEGRGKQYGDFAIGNFVTGNKGEMAVAKYLHSIKPFKDLSRAVDLDRRDYGDGGVDIHWGRWRIDVKTTGIKHGPLVCDASEPQFHQANLFILAHLKFDGIEKVEGTNTFKAKKNHVDIYGFLTAAEYYELDDQRRYVRAHYYDDPQLPTKLKVECWLLRNIRDLMPTTTA